MKAGKEVGFVDLVRRLNEQGIRYLIVGRRAVVLYGGPVLTADYDLWIHSDDKQKVLAFLEETLGFELSRPPGTRSPLVTAFSGMKKFDLFFHRRIRTFDGENIEFETCYQGAVMIEDEKEDVRFRVPSIDDLIKLKRIREPNVKDEQDVAYLLKAKQILKRKRGRY